MSSIAKKVVFEEPETESVHRGTLKFMTGTDQLKPMGPKGAPKKVFFDEPEESKPPSLGTPKFMTGSDTSYITISEDEITQERLMFYNLGYDSNGNLNVERTIIDPQVFREQMVTIH